MSTLKQKLDHCVAGCSKMVTSRVDNMLSSAWLDGADAVARAIAQEVVQKGDGAVSICGVEVAPCAPDTVPEMVAKLRSAIIAKGVVKA